MTEYLNTKNLTEAVSGVREMKAPKHFLPEMLSKIIVCSLDCPDEDKEHASTLIHTLRTEGLITGENFMQVCLLFIQYWRAFLCLSTNTLVRLKTRKALLLFHNYFTEIDVIICD